MSTSLDLSKLSLMDALDLAKLIELEACHRYQMFASQLGHTGGGARLGGGERQELGLVGMEALPDKKSFSRWWKSGFI